MPIAVDLFIVLLVLLAAFRGWRTGGLLPLLRLTTLLAGLLLGLWVARLLTSSLSSLSSLSPVWHVLLGVGCAIGGLLLGAYVGRRVGAAVLAARPALPDRVLGVAVRGAVALVVCGFVAGLVVAFGPSSWSTAVRASVLGPDSPSGVPVAGEIWDGVSRLVEEAAPADLAALVPATTVALPTQGSIDAVDDAVADSVLKITTTRCDTTAVGTGFVAATESGDDLVVTNAHVVSGAEAVRVGDRDATVIAFDERTDLAVLRVADLDAPALTLAADDAVNGAALVVVGYPGGGPRTAVGAAVIQRMPVPNPGLAGGPSLHQAYRLQAVIEHGNSGSPLLDLSGRVVGVVNALADGAGARGYAISIDELQPLLTTAASNHTAVSTGACSATP